MANAINPSSDPALVVLANKALIAAKPALIRAGAFTLDISNDAVAPGTTLKVGIFDSASASAFGSSHNYGTGDGSMSFASVTFAQYVKSYAFTDAQLTEVPEGLFVRAGEAAGVGCSQKVSDAITAALKGGTYTTAAAIKVPHGTTAANITKAIVSKIVAGCDCDASRSVLVLSKEFFYAVASLYDASIYGSVDAVRAGLLDGGVYGLKGITWSGDLPDGVIGLMVPEDALVVAFRKVPCASTTAYDEVVDQTDPDSGFAFQVRRYADPATGTNKVSGSVMIGCGIAQAAKIQKVEIAAS